jgi:hypothetical protein
MYFGIWFGCLMKNEGFVKNQILKFNSRDLCYESF